MSERIYSLDAMRGIAAVLVMSYHLGFVAHQAAPGGYLAVDFFFVLSGYVLARHFAERIGGTISPGAFILDRFVRLYPMFILGVAVAVAGVGVEAAIDSGEAAAPGHLAISLATSLFLLPSASGTDLFPLNGPAWSLFFEFAMNAAFAFWLAKASIRSLVAVAAAAAVAIVLSASLNGSLSVGWTWATAWGGAARAVFGFVVGIVLARLPERRATPTALMFLPTAVLAAMLLVTVPPAVRPAFDVVAVLLISPLLVFLGTRWQAPPAVVPASRVLGALSYPLYAIHYPTIIVAVLVAGHVNLAPEIWLPAVIVGLLLAAFLLGRHVERPMQRAMSRMLDRLFGLRGSP